MDVALSGLKVEFRLLQHNTNHFGEGHFTSSVDDWELYIKIECKNQSQALQIEQHIKGMKSRKYIENLKRYPEMIEGLLEKYAIKKSI